MKAIVFAYFMALFSLYSFESLAQSKKISNSQEIEASLPNTVEINAFPNPFNDGVNLEIITNNSHPTTVKVFDIIGIERERIELMQFGSQNIYKIQLKDLPAGVYFCNVYSDKKLLESKKIVCLK
jgi:hypothetical protein